MSEQASKINSFSNSDANVYADYNFTGKSEKFVYHLTNMLDHSAQPLVAMAADGRIIFCNLAFADLTGYTKNELYQMSSLDITPAKWWEIEKKVFYRVYNTGEPQKFEKEYTCKTGLQIPVEIILHIVRPYNDGCAFYYAFVRDNSALWKLRNQVILEKHRAKILRQKMKRNRNLLHAVMENAGSHLAYLDPEFNFLQVNSTYAQGSGYTKKELIGRNHFDLFPNEENARLFKYAATTGKTVEFKAKPFKYINHPWKGVTYWDWKLTPVKNPAGTVEGLLLSLNDVTEEARTKKFNQALDNINETINGTGDFKKIMHRVIVESAKAMECDSAGIILPEEGYWVLKYLYGLPPEAFGMRLTLAEVPIPTLCQETRQPIAVSDIYTDERVNRKLLEKLGIRSFLAVPLIAREEIIGVLYFNFHGHPVVYSPSQIDFANKLGNALSLATDNARLYETERNEASTLATLFEHLPVGMALLDKNLHYKQINAYVAAITGHRPEELIGTSLTDHITQYLGADKAEETVALFKRTLTTGENLVFKGLRIKHMSRPAEPFYIDCQISRVEGPSGDALGILVTVFDVTRHVLDKKALKTMEGELIKHRDHLEEIIKNRTKELLEANRKLKQEIMERTETEKALLLSEERFSKAFNASPTIMSINSVTTGKYLYVNDSFISYTGYSRGEIIGSTVSDLKLFDTSVNYRKILALLRDDKPIQNLEVKYITKTGEKRVGLLSTEIIYLNGEECILLVINDVTEKKRLEMEMARLDKLNLIGEMAAGIGHEIRNPMTTARGFLQLLYNKETCQQKKEYYSLIIEELDRANAIITEFLSLAKNKPVHPMPLNLNKVVQTLAALIQADAILVNKHVKLELGELPYIVFDEMEIRQLILNLARNGLEAMEEGGTLTLKTFVTDGHVVLVVQDEGQGIAPEVLDKIGTPFVTTKEKRTGIGLAICYSIAARHNAVIDVKTGPNGTAFYVKFKP